jgi:O-succinylhomoserine sulfhydrylase
MSAGGTVVTFELNASDPEIGKKRAFALLDALRVIDISNNLGDTKTLITHPATTTHRSIGAQARGVAGITDGVVRLSVGLEDVEDLIADLNHALSCAT